MSGSPSETRERVIRYAIAVALAVLALVIRGVLPIEEGRVPYVVAFSAIIASAWFGGRGPGLLSIAVSALGVAYFFIPPVRSLGIAEGHRLGHLLFIVTAVVMVELTASRRIVQRSLRESEERFRLMAENLGEVLWIHSLRPETVLYVSPSFQRVWGHVPSHLVANPRLWLESIHPEDRPRVDQAWSGLIAEKGDFDEEYRIHRPDGTVRWIHDHGVLIRDERGRAYRACGIAEDITGRKQMAEALARVQTELAHVTRVSTMGELAASISHEINQPLTAIVANANALVRWLAHDPPEMEELRQASTRISDEGKRAGAIVERVRGLTRKAPPSREPLLINDVVLDVLSLIGAEAQKYRISVEPALAPRLPKVLGDRVQLQQVLLNLSVNAIESMSTIGDGPRRLVIGSGEYEAGRVQVVVADTGAGLNQDAAERLFEPFFSTKPRGLGMGLAISRSIVESHGGRIVVGPNAPRGTVFRFSLPAKHSTAA
jgi:PAS domain S-box-containing protein